MDHILSHWKSIAGIALAWAISGGLGWSLARGLIDGNMDKAISWTLGMGIGWAIGGFVLGWHLLKTISNAEPEVGKLKEQSNGATEISSRTDNVHLPSWVSVFWIILGWIISAAIATGMAAIDINASYVALPIFGAMGGLVIAITLRIEHVLSGWKSLVWIMLSWAIGGALVAAGILLNWAIYAYEVAILFAVFGAIGGAATAFTLRLGHRLSDWKNLVWVTFGWAIGWAINAIMVGRGEMVLLVGAVTGTAIGGSIMIWQLREQARKL